MMKETKIKEVPKVNVGLNHLVEENLQDNPVRSANILNRIFFIWVLPILYKGFRGNITAPDLYRTLPEDSSRALGDRLEEEWNKELKETHENPKYRPSLNTSLRRIFIGKYTFYCFIAIIEECGLKIIQPYLLFWLVQWIQNHDLINDDKTHAYLITMGLIMSTILYSKMDQHLFFSTQHLGMKIRVAISTLLYRKCLRLSRASLNQTACGQMINIFSNDLNRVEIASKFSVYLLAAPLQLIIGSVLLYFHIGVATLIGFGVFAVYVPIQVMNAKLFLNFCSKTANKTDYRLRIMNEIISGLRVIKMYTWEKPFQKLIDLARKSEVNRIRKTYYLRAFTTSMFFAFSKLITYLTVTCFFLLDRGKLNAADIFLVVCLYSNIRMTMTGLFSMAIAQLAEASVSIERAKNFLLMKEKNESIETTNYSLTETDDHEQLGLWVNNITSTWTPGTDERTLQSISFTVLPRQLLAIVGPMGSGKSSILQSILGELPIFNSSGSIRVIGKLAYTSQEPWVFSESLRDNIVFGRQFEPIRYKLVIKACALNKDIRLLPYGDRTLLGERGTTLSGGQKARVNLARAVYQNADIYLLDDPLSAVDTQVGRHLFEDCICRFLRDKTIILVTHQLQYLRKADHIIILKDGHIEARGTFTELTEKGVDFLKLLPEEEKKKSTEIQSRGESIKRRGTRRLSRIGTSRLSIRDGDSFADYSDDEEEPEDTDEQMSTGRIGLKTYFGYFNAGTNSCSLLLLAFAIILAQACFTGTDYWLNLWIKHDPNNTVRAYSTNAGDIPHTFDFFRWLEEEPYSFIYVYSGLVALLVLFSFIRTYYYYAVCNKSSVKLHNKMFSSVLSAPIRFVDSNPIGRIMNRFGKDVGEMDDILPPTLFEMTSILLQVTGVIIINSIVSPWNLIPSAVLLLLCLLIRKYAIFSIRPIKRLESLSRSPVFSHLSTSIRGLTTIRAIGAEDLFKKNFERHQDVNTSASYLLIATTRWLAVCLDWLCNCYLALISYGLIAFAASRTKTADGFSADVALAISSAMSLTVLFQYGVRLSADVDNQMVSVERVMEFTKLEKEKFEGAPGTKPPPTWPTKGRITFENVSLRYGPDEPLVLKNLSCDINGKEKIGIVGRTGAGKSTLLSALFRMSEPDGNVIIDGIPINDLGLHDVRSKLSIIPQDPVLFTGTMRFNLDPFTEFSDLALWEALEEAKLKQSVTELPGGLDAQMDEGGSNFSVGERQMVCLARAILRRNRILVLDEATANVDPNTDALIQNTIRKTFVDCTVLTIAHRLNTIMDSDKVMVMNAGRVVELDEPHILLQNRNSIFSQLVHESGPSNEIFLKDIAFKAHIARKQQQRSSYMSMSPTPSGEYVSSIVLSKKESLVDDVFTVEEEVEESCEEEPVDNDTGDSTNM